MNVLVLVFGSISLAVAAQFVLRHGMVEAAAAAQAGGNALWWAASTSPKVWFGLLMYVGSAAVWLGVLARWEVSKAYPMVGLGFLISVAIGWALGEQVNAGRVFGAVLIAAGVVLTARS